MSTETVDIIVKENGSAAAATNVRGIGTAAHLTSEQMDRLLLSMNGSNLKLAEIARATGSVESQMSNLGRSTVAAAAGHKVHNEEMSRGTELAGRLREMLVAVGLALGVHEWVELTDAYQRNINGLVQITSSQENLVQVQKALRQVSMDTFSSLDTNTTLYVRLTKAGKDLNLTQDQMITVIRVLNDGLRLAGNSTGDAGRAITQLSIAMMTGEGSSRAMLAIMRQMPDLTQAIASSFFTGKDSVLQFKEAVTSGTISVQQVLRAIVSLSSQQNTLSKIQREGASAADTVAKATLTEAEHSMIAAGRMYDLSKVTGETGKHFIDLSHGMVGVSQQATDLAGKTGHVSTSLHQTNDELAKVGPVAQSGFGRAHAAIQAADGAMPKFEQNVKKVEPTIADAWTNMKSALFAYVGEADQASGASEKIAHIINLAAQNGRVFFGVIGIITAFLGVYTVAAGAAYLSTTLFVTAFSRLALGASIIAALVVAIYTFGQSIKVTADGSISVLGALLGAFDLVKQGVLAVWQLAQQAPDYWGPAVLAVTGLTIAFRVLLGVNIITWLVQATGAMVSLTLATIAALGPWGLLIAAITAAALAYAYWSGTLDGAIATLKEKFTPLVNGLIDKMKQFTTESQKSGTAAREFGDVWTGETTRVTNGFENSLLPAIKKVDSALGGLASDAASSMASTKTSVNDVAAALGAITAGASSAGSALAGVKGPSSGSNQQPTTHIFGGLNYYPRTDGLDQAFARASALSAEDGNPFQNGSPVVDMIKAFGRGGSWNMTQAAEITAALRNMSSTGKNYLKTIFPWIPGLQYGGSFRVGGTGGTDSQLVQFMASPDETVSVQTPQQAATGNGGKQVTVHMTVLANDAQSFQRSNRQLVTQLESQLARVAMRG